MAGTIIYALFFLMQVTGSVSQVLSNNRQQPVVIVAADKKGISPRIRFGIDRLVIALKNAGYETRLTDHLVPVKGNMVIVAGLQTGSSLQKLVSVYHLRVKMPAKEGFSIVSAKNMLLIDGADDSGVLYGCLQLGEEVQKQNKIPAGFSCTDA